MTTAGRAKPNEITKREVYNAWKRVKANKGAAGVDGVGLEEFESKLSGNLYKLWNRLSSGSYFPQAVMRVEIPKKDGSMRPLGIPTVGDRVAQEVVRARLEPKIEPLFHQDSYGYRAGKSAIEAIGICRKRSWEYDWVLDVDIQGFFDSIDHELLLKAVRKHSPERWMTLYIERWLKAPIEYEDGRREQNDRGTPQGGVISPVLANLFLHYAFDEWMRREYPSVKFERYADDIIVHCHRKAEAEELKSALGLRLGDCGLKLHPEKTRIVYCADSNRRDNYAEVSFTFLGYTFKPRRAKGRQGKRFTSFLPAVGRQAQRHFLQKLAKMRVQLWVTADIDNVAKDLNPLVGGWFRYFCQFYPTELSWVYLHIDRRLLRWAMNKYRWNIRLAQRWLAELKTRQPSLFAHWVLITHTSG